MPNSTLTPPTQETSEPESPQVYPSTGRGIGVIALVVGIVSVIAAIIAMVLGFAGLYLGFLAILLGVAAIIFGIAGMRKSSLRGPRIAGLVTGIGGTVLGFLYVVATGALLLMQSVVPLDANPPVLPGSEGTPPAAPSPATQTITTPCYEFDGPARYVNNIPREAVADCVTELELWGERAADGTINATGVGAIHANLLVQPISADFLSQNAPSGSLDELVANLEVSYFPQLGEGIASHDEIVLDGVPAHEFSIEPFSDARTQSRSAVVVLSPGTGTHSSELVGYVIIVSTVEDDGDSMLQALVNSWKWR